jgi:phosphatidylserine/phosphatidylglycerophosphate/cardiolipin synthase-like enzyme
MAEFLTTRGISYRLEQLIDQANTQLTFISPYLKVPVTLLERMKAAERRGVLIQMVYGKKDLKNQERDKLRALKKVAIRYSEHLHAKCYANESAIIIGSMNLYDYSEFNNLEMGVLLTAGDGDVFVKAREEVRRVLESSVHEQPPSVVREVLATLLQRPKVTNRSPSIRTGSCIRCKSSIPYRPQAPLCDSCFKSWVAWSNEDYPERNCHRCGKVADVSKARPLCYSCFREEPFSAVG